jgi:hypothetical protein
LPWADATQQRRQVQLAGDLADGLAGAADELDDLSLVLRREEPAWSWHRTPISRAKPSSWVSTKPGQLHTVAWPSRSLITFTGTPALSAAVA